jgi:GT2 family glycosyltransferase
MIGVVIVNWNRAQDTVAAYQSLIPSTFEDWRLYVVDNASSDDSAAVLDRDLGAKATLILNDSNAGFSGGCNLGVARALADGATHIFLLNNDATVLPCTLERLIGESLAEGDRAVLGCAVKHFGTDTYQFFGSHTASKFGTPLWFEDDELEKLASRVIESDFVLGAALFAPARIWREIGDLDDRFYLNYEEADWCYRAREAGFACYVVPAAVVLHRVGASIGPTNGPMQAYFLSRNELLFARRHATLSQINRLFARSLSNLLKTAIKDLIRFRNLAAPTKAHARGLYDFVCGRFGDCPALIRKFAADHRAA